LGLVSDLVLVDVS